MEDPKSTVRICSSGPAGQDMDEVEAYSTAYIRRFCETLNQIVDRNEEGKKKAELKS